MNSLSAQNPSGNQTYSNPSRGGRGGSTPKLGLATGLGGLLGSLKGDFDKDGVEVVSAFVASGRISGRELSVLFSDDGSSNSREEDSCEWDGSK